MFAFCVKAVALFICFIFTSAFFAGAGKACSEERWVDFGFEFMMAIIYVAGMWYIFNL